jgi:hypothetical protein
MVAAAFQGMKEKGSSRHGRPGHNGDIMERAIDGLEPQSYRPRRRGWINGVGAGER